MRNIEVEKNGFKFIYSTITNPEKIPISDIDGLGVGKFLLMNDSNLIHASIPEGIDCIGVWAFRGCYNLDSVSLPNTLNTIKQGAFWDCISLTEVNIPQNVQSIERDAFKNCKNLLKVVFPESIGWFHPLVFHGCVNLKTIETRISKGKNFYSKGNCLISYKNNKVVFGCRNSDVPDGITQKRALLMQAGLLFIR